MATRTVRTLTLVAGVLWFAVAGYGMRSAVIDDDGDWALSYRLFSLALLVGAALVVSVVALLTRDCDRPRLRVAGLIVSSLGVLSSVVAWALPLWMTILGVGLALLAIAAAPSPSRSVVPLGPRQRRSLALLAAAQLVGLAVLIAAIETHVGRRDEFGDYPAAGGIALVVTAALTVVALLELRRGLAREMTQGAELAVSGSST